MRALWGAVVGVVLVLAAGAGPASAVTPGFLGTGHDPGVAVDAAGNIYGAEVGPKKAMKYTKK